MERALSGSVTTAPKSGKMRVVPLGAPALAAIKRVKRRPNFTRPDDYVFATLAGDRPDPSALRRRYNLARDQAGVPALTFHGLRHTAASLLIRKMDVQIVKTIMGHASIKTTERYLHAVAPQTSSTRSPTRSPGRRATRSGSPITCEHLIQKL